MDPTRVDGHRCLEPEGAVQGPGSRQDRADPPVLDAAARGSTAARGRDLRVRLGQPLEVPLGLPEPGAHRPFDEHLFEDPPQRADGGERPEL